MEISRIISDWVKDVHTIRLQNFEDDVGLQRWRLEARWERSQVKIDRNSILYFDYWVSSSITINVCSSFLLCIITCQITNFTKWNFLAVNKKKLIVVSAIALVLIPERKHFCIWRDSPTAFEVRLLAMQCHMYADKNWMDCWLIDT